MKLVNFIPFVTLFPPVILVKLYSVPLTVTFKVDGVTYKTKKVAYGELVEEPASPTKENYVFSSWEDSEWGMPFEFTQKIFKDITFTFNILFHVFMFI